MLQVATEEVKSDSICSRSTQNYLQSCNVSIQRNRCGHYVTFNVHIIFGLVLVVQIIDALNGIGLLAMCQIVADDSFQPILGCIAHELLNGSGQFDNACAFRSFAHHTIYRFLSILVHHVHSCSSHEEKHDTFVMVLP